MVTPFYEINHGVIEETPNVILDMLPRLHSLIIGPGFTIVIISFFCIQTTNYISIGLGRLPEVWSIVSKVVKDAKAAKKQ